MIRGLGGKRVEILQNSTSVGDASDISADHAVASEALLADRIEILRGPATLRFGPGRYRRRDQCYRQPYSHSPVSRV